MKPTLQWLRHSTQILVFAFIFLTPLMAIYGEYLYTNYYQDQSLDEILKQWPPSVQRYSLSIIDSIFQGTDPYADRIKVLGQLQNFRGNTWSAEIFGISLTDPLAAAGSIFSSRSINSTVLISIAIPVIATIILGRIFCSWICPIGFLLEMTGKFRQTLTKLKIPPKNVLLWRGNKFALLVGGLILTAVIGIPVLNELYPPALIGREIHSEAQFLFQRAENGLFHFSLGGLTGISLFILSIVIVELFISKRMWCRYLCPGGALYALLGKKRLIKVQFDKSKCTECMKCIHVCGMGLNPTKEAKGVECDNCLACVSVCDDRALLTRLPPGEKDNNS